MSRDEWRKRALFILPLFSLFVLGCGQIGEEEGRKALPSPSPIPIAAREEEERTEEQPTEDDGGRRRVLVRSTKLVGFGPKDGQATYEVTDHRTGERSLAVVGLVTGALLEQTYPKKAKFVYSYGHVKTRALQGSPVSTGSSEVPGVMLQALKVPSSFVIYKYNGDDDVGNARYERVLDELELVSLEQGGKARYQGRGGILTVDINTFDLAPGLMNSGFGGGGLGGGFGGGYGGGGFGGFGR